MSRRSARKNAFFLLFQTDFNHAEEYEDVKRIFFAERNLPEDEQSEEATEDAYYTEPIEEADKKFILSEVDGTRANLAEIDRIIGESAKGWNTQRMSRVDLTILRLAVYEMRFSENIPVGVAINEAVELAKEFSSNEAPSFINGILGKIAKGRQELSGNDNAGE